MHTFKVYEVLDGKEFDTKKTVLLPYPVNRETVVVAVFALYGFTQYQPNYTLSRNTEDIIGIQYNYLQDGYKETWVLRRGL